MKTLEKSPKRLWTLLTFSILLILISRPLFAEEDRRQVLKEQLLSVGEHLYDTADQADADLLEITQQLNNAEALLNDKNANTDYLVRETAALQEKIKLMRTKRAEVDQKFADINQNYEKYVFQTRAKVIVPFLYATIGLSMAKDDEKLLYSLAGYGTGALVENTGYGLSNGITWLTYSFIF